MDATLRARIAVTLLNDTTDDYVKTRRTLIKLRISVARAAQAAHIPLACIGCADDAPYEVLHEAAAYRESGWNTLVADIVDRLVFLGSSHE